MTAAPTGAPARRRPLRRGAVWTPYLFLAPFLTVFGTFVAFPALRGLWMSLHDWDHLMATRPFVGLANYTALLDPASVLYQRFWDGMAATGIFVVASVPLLLTAPLLLAMALNRRFPGRTFLRAVVFLPYVLGVAVVAVLFRFVLDPNLGVLNHLLATTRLDRVLHALGAGDPVPWLTAQPWAWVSLVGVTLWWTIGFNTIIYLAGLQDVPAELYDAARVDGASARQRFRHVTLPGLRPVLAFVLTMTVLASANMFGQSDLMTGGGPGTSTRTALMVILDTGMGQFRMGAAAAMGYVLSVGLGVVSVVSFVALRERS